MTTSWRIMLNSRLWNQEKYQRDFDIQPEVRRLAQSKGRCRMVSCPTKGDYAFFVYKGHIVMRGIIESEGFESGNEHQTHSSNMGAVRLHALPNEFVWVRIIEVGLSIHIRATGQRTWAKVPSDTLPRLASFHLSEE